MFEEEAPRGQGSYGLIPSQVAVGEVHRSPAKQQYSVGSLNWASSGSVTPEGRSTFWGHCGSIVSRVLLLLFLFLLFLRLFLSFHMPSLCFLFLSLFCFELNRLFFIFSSSFRLFLFRLHLRCPCLIVVLSISFFSSVSSPFLYLPHESCLHDFFTISP